MKEYFGITFLDLVRAFHGTTVDDFESDGQTGQQIIERELELAADEVIDMMDNSVISLIDGNIAPYIVSTCADPSGNSYIELLGIPDDCSIQVRLFQEFDRNSYDVYQQDTLGSCKKFCGKLDIDDFEEFNDWTIDGNRLVLGSSYEDNQKILISYKLQDGVTPKIPSIGRYIRNKVACQIGHNLYSAGGDTWALVENFCKEAARFEDKYETKKLIPAELRKIKWLNTPFSIGIFSLPIRRV